MRRIATWILSTLSVTVLLFGYHTSTSGPASTGAETVISSATSGSGATTSGSGNGAGNRSSSGKAASTTTVTGSVVNTRYGPIQVAIRTNGSSITDVSVLQYPNSNSQDTQINGYALPVLIQSTMNAQNANVDMVSGATFTSAGYQQSLQSALDQAGL